MTMVAFGLVMPHKLYVIALEGWQFAMFSVSGCNHFCGSA